MIDQVIRQSILSLHAKGISQRQISKLFELDRKTVQRIIAQDGQITGVPKKNKIIVAVDLLAELHHRCGGRVERIHEILTKNHGCKIGYSTLSALIRESDLGEKGKERASCIPDIPGDECQHDTSPYLIEIGGKKVRVQASLVYYRYSKVRYLIFYRSFTRFHMKCFFHEALAYFGYVPKICIIDNTHLAVLRGTGDNAVFVPEMIAFAKQYGFKWKAHAIKHSDRKAGNERAFWTVETNFFPGRSFSSMDDLNRQALQWVQEREHKPTTKRKIIPADAFTFEIPHMNKVFSDLPAPYLQHQRTVDQYGYIAFDANFFWVPHEAKRDVLILEYSKKICIYSNRKQIVEYALPSEEVRNEKFSPKGVSLNRQPWHRKPSSSEHEKWLREQCQEVVQYLDGGIKAGNGPKGRHRFITTVYTLASKLAPEIFLAAIRRASLYKVYDLEALDRICSLIIQAESYEPPEPDICFGYEDRAEYREGEHSEAPGAGFYEKKFGGKENERAEGESETTTTFELER